MGLPKFCKICFTVGKPPNPKVYTSHNTVSCNVLSTSDRRDMLVALQAMNLSDDFAAIKEGEEININYVPFIQVLELFS